MRQIKIVILPLWHIVMSPPCLWAIIILLVSSYVPIVQKSGFKELLQGISYGMFGVAVVNWIDNIGKRISLYNEIQSCSEKIRKHDFNTRNYEFFNEFKENLKDILRDVLKASINGLVNERCVADLTTERVEDPITLKDYIQHLGNKTYGHVNSPQTHPAITDDEIRRLKDCYNRFVSHMSDYLA